MAAYIEEHGVTSGGLWMVHNYVKQARFDGRLDRLRDVAWGIIVDNVAEQAGKRREEHAGSLQFNASDGLYHIVGCSSPE